MNTWWEIEIGDAIDATVAIAVLALYGGAFLRGARLGQLTATDWLIGGICLTWFGTLVDRTWRLSWRILHHPHWMQNSPVLLISLIVVALGGVMHIAAKHENGSVSVVKSWRQLALSFGVGLIIGLAAIWATLSTSLREVGP